MKDNTKRGLALAGVGAIALFAMTKSSSSESQDGWASGSGGGSGESGDTPEVFKKDLVTGGENVYNINFPKVQSNTENIGMNDEEIVNWFDNNFDVDTTASKKSTTADLSDYQYVSGTGKTVYETPQGYGVHGGSSPSRGYNTGSVGSVKRSSDRSFNSIFKKEASAIRKSKADNLRHSSVKKDAGMVKKGNVDRAVKSIYNPSKKLFG